MTEEVKTIALHGVDKLREAGYIGYENGEFVKAKQDHDWLQSTSRWRFCIICGRREHFSVLLGKWVNRGEVEIKEVEI